MSTRPCTTQLAGVVSKSYPFLFRYEITCMPVSPCPMHRLCFSCHLCKLTRPCHLLTPHQGWRGPAHGNQVWRLLHARGRRRRWRRQEKIREGKQKEEQQEKVGEKEEVDFTLLLDVVLSWLVFGPTQSDAAVLVARQDSGGEGFCIIWSVSV